ncbi:MAG: AEC family transporter [Lachnospiraceae bacterium]|nr:AEC family transporter [Lachnospiraceae bacterium]
MDNLIFSLNATIPVFLLMLLGVFFRRIGWMEESFAGKCNTFVFRVALPVLVFEDLATVDFGQVWNLRFVGFCFGATALSITIVTVIAFLLVKPAERGEFVQAAYRSSAALLGIAFIQNIYGDSGMAPLMIIGSVPLYNIFAVVVLSVLSPETAGDRAAGERSAAEKRALWKKTAKGILTNPILIGILLGLLWSALGIPLTGILQKTVKSVGAVATPLGLMAMGAGFDAKRALESGKTSILAAFFKLIGLAVIFLPIAVGMGFRSQELVAILVMLGSATTVSSYVMAKNMGHEGTVSGSTVMLTTLLSAFTLTFWLWLLRNFGLI